MTAIARPARRPSDRLVLGASLLAIGGVLLAAAAIPGLDRSTLLLVSGVSLAAFAASREYGFAVATGITGGLGTMVALVADGTLAATAAGGVFFGSLAGGFVAIWLLGLAAEPRERHPWPLVTGGVLGALGIAVATQTAATFDLLQVGIATLLVAGGIAIVLRRDRPA